MVSQLETLLTLRRDDEKTACLALEAAVTARAGAELEQDRLVARWRAAKAALEQERASWSAAPASAAQALAREAYRRRLEYDVEQALRGSESHRADVLAMASAAEIAARALYALARQAREAAAKVKERADAETEKRVERRAEDAAAEQALAAFTRRRD